MLAKRFGMSFTARPGGRNQNGLLRVLRPPQTLNTETTEALSDLCVEFLLVTEDTEALLVREENFARRQEVWE